MGTFRAMGTEVTVLAPRASISEEDRLTRRVRALFEQNERMFSRFRPESALSTLNGATAAVSVPDELFSALERAEAYRRLTRGAFDVRVGASLVACGYDRSFTAGGLDRAASSEPAAAVASGPCVRLDPATRSIDRPAGVLLDLGGMIKGFTVDRARELLPACAAIDAGGDAYLRGAGPDGAGWQVDIEDPHDADRTLMTLRVHDRAVATSSPNRRNWRVGPEQMHHLMDPHTGRPSRSSTTQVTVVASTVELAEVLAKAVFVLDAGTALELLAGLDGVAAVLVDRSGDVLRVGSLEVEHA